MNLILPRQSIRELTCEGTPFEMGLVQGETFRDEIHRSLETVRRLEAVRLLKPPLLPLNPFLRIAEFKAERFLKQAFSNVQQSGPHRLRGIAQGAGIPLRRLALVSALEAVLSDLAPVTAQAVSAGCSAIAVTRNASKMVSPLSPITSTTSLKSSPSTSFVIPGPKVD